MNPSHTVTPRPEMEITEDNTIRDNHDDQLLEDDGATPVVTPSQGTPTEHNSNSPTLTGITTPVQTPVNASIPDEATPSMFRQALENAPNLSSFLQTS